MKKVQKFVPKKKVQKFVPKPRPQVTEERRLTEQELTRVMTDAWERQQRIKENRARMGISDDGDVSPVKVKTPAERLAERQRDARSVGMREPIAITEWGENVYPWGKGYTPPPGWSNSPTASATAASAPAAPTVTKFVPKGPGVIDTIIKVLTEEASKKKPMSKAKLVERLSVLIPHRTPEKMAQTVRAQLCASGLPSRGVKLQGDEKKGYWIFK